MRLRLVVTIAAVFGLAPAAPAAATFRGRRWTCTVSSTFESLRCTTSGRRVSWRNPG